MGCDLRLLVRLRSLSAGSVDLTLSGLDFFPPKVSTIEVPFCFFEGDGLLESELEAAGGGEGQSRVAVGERREETAEWRVASGEWRLAFRECTLQPRRTSFWRASLIANLFTVDCSAVRVMLSATLARMTERELESVSSYGRPGPKQAQAQAGVPVPRWISEHGSLQWYARLGRTDLRECCPIADSSIGLPHSGQPTTTSREGLISPSVVGSGLSPSRGATIQVGLMLVTLGNLQYSRSDRLTCYCLLD